MVSQCTVCRVTTRSNPNLKFHKFPTKIEDRNIWFLVLGIDPASSNLPKSPKVCTMHFAKEDYFNKKDGKLRLKPGAVPIPSKPVSSLSRLATQPEVEHLKEPDTLSDLESLPEDTNTGVELCISSEEEEDEKKFSITNQGLPEVTITGSELFIKEEEEDGNDIGMPNEGAKLLATHPEVIDLDELSTSSASSTEMERKTYLEDLSSDDFATPSKRERNFKLIKDIIKKKDMKIKSLHNNIRYLRKRVRLLEDFVNCHKKNSGTHKSQYY